uniref:Transcription elongation factor NusA n=1 Tax=Ignisphaera aggregans TaxID=334771 RepID=A0A7C2Z9E8_9CREN
MKIPLDVICVRSGVLCPRCRRIIESNEHSELEVDIMRYLLELENDNNFRFLKNAGYVKSYKVDSTIIVIIDIHEHVSRQSLIRLGRALEERLGLKVRIVQKSPDPKAFISQLISPARIQGIDSVWTPDGSVQHIVRIPRSDARLLPLRVDVLESLLSSIYNEVYRVKISY